jgi:hypothetical protein
MLTSALSYRFCSTGPPIMNGVSDFHSLYHFLRLQPYHDFKDFNRNFADILKPDSGAREIYREKAMQQIRVLCGSVLLCRKKQGLFCVMSCHMLLIAESHFLLQTHSRVNRLLSFPSSRSKRNTLNSQKMSAISTTRLKGAPGPGTGDGWPSSIHSDFPS